MKRSPMPPRSKPMPRQRAGIRRTATPDTLAAVTTPKARKPLKSRSTPKMTPARKSAKGQDCTLCLPGCPNATETTVLCHLPMFGDGGMGFKAPDHIAVYGDFHCHNMIDGRTKCPVPKPDLYEYLIRALIRTHRIMRAKGILMMKGEEE
jgi:hypothetical protein